MTGAQQGTDMIHDRPGRRDMEAGRQSGAWIQLSEFAAEVLVLLGESPQPREPAVECAVRIISHNVA